MQKIYEIELVGYQVRYSSRGRKEVQYDCIDFGESQEYCETLEEAERIFEREYEMLRDDECGVIIHEITSVKDYNSLEEFVEEFEECGVDDKNFFINPIKELNKKIEEEMYLEYLKSEDFKKEIERRVVGKVFEGLCDVDDLKDEICDLFKYIKVEAETDTYEENIFLYGEGKIEGLIEIEEYYLGKVIFEYSEDEKQYTIKGIEWSK